jgi:hypothetical protein
MLHSIRWRLIISYTALTLLTILLIGVVALSLLTRYMAAREYETLTLNAEAVARMARPLLARPNQGPRLQQLAITSGFLTNTELRILDRDRRPVAYSQMRLTPLDSSQAVMRLLSELSRSGKEEWQKGLISPVIVVSGPGHPRGMVAMDVDESDPLTEEGAALSLERRPGFMGDRLVIVDPAGALPLTTRTRRRVAPQHPITGRRPESGGSFSAMRQRQFLPLRKGLKSLFRSTRTTRSLATCR